MISRSVFCCTLFLILTHGFAEVQLVQAKIEPSVAAAGEKVNAVVEFSGITDIQQVLIIPREHAYDLDEPFALQKADSTKNEVWVLETTVPYEATSEEIHLEIKAVDKNSNEIVIKEFAEQEFGKAGLIKFEIK
jgi:hypothetical protein